jgi:starch phosphorylase
MDHHRPSKRRREQQLARLQQYIHHREPVKIQVEDDRTGMDLVTLKRAFTNHLNYNQGKDQPFATNHDYYMALARTVRDRLVQRRIKTAQTYSQQKAKVVYLPVCRVFDGASPGQWADQPGLHESPCAMPWPTVAWTWTNCWSGKPNPAWAMVAWGAGGLLYGLPHHPQPSGGGLRHSLRVWHFTQAIRDGYQVEIPDKWLSFGNPWEIARPDYRVSVKFGGYTQVYKDEDGDYRVRWVPGRR